jgi:molybdenum cofactor synthesis domain-containing protein
VTAVPAPPPYTAALIVVGNEILSGKIRDENGPYLISQLRPLGVELRRVEVVPDEEELIIDAVSRCRRAAVHLFTSGGIGTTHDDVTVPAIAQALGRKVMQHPALMGMLRARYGEQLDDVRARLAEVPEDAELLWGAANELRFPAIFVDDVLILPGVPSLFIEKFEAVKERYRAPPIALANLFLRVDEPEIAQLLVTATEKFRGVSIGSYPRFDPADHSVKVTIESRDEALVEACTAFLREALRGSVVRESKG